MIEPNSDNRCSNPEDANWAAPFLFGRWAWDGYLFGAHLDGPGKSLIDATYNYGFNRLKGKLPANTFGGYSPTSTAPGTTPATAAGACRALTTAPKASSATSS